MVLRVKLSPLSATCGAPSAPEIRPSVVRPVPTQEPLTKLTTSCFTGFPEAVRLGTVKKPGRTGVTLPPMLVGQSKGKFGTDKDVVKGTVLVADTEASSATDLFGLTSNAETKIPQVSARVTA